MKTLRKIIDAVTAAALLAGLALTFSGCTENGALNSQKIGSEGKVVQSNVGPIRILGMGSESVTLRKSGTVPDSVFHTQKFIKAGRGGSLKVGNRTYGHSKIVFGKNALPHDESIDFSWASSGTFEGLLSNLEFGPHGTAFNYPVKLELSYKKADLTGVDENDLRVFYFNEDTGLWELIGGEVNKKGKKVTVYLNHFSRYAIGAE